MNLVNLLELHVFAGFLFPQICICSHCVSVCSTRHCSASDSVCKSSLCGCPEAVRTSSFDSSFKSYSKTSGDKAECFIYWRDQRIMFLPWLCLGMVSSQLWGHPVHTAALCLAQHCLLRRPKRLTGTGLCSLEKQCLLAQSGNEELGMSNLWVVVLAVKMIDSSVVPMGRHVSVFIQRFSSSSWGCLRRRAVVMPLDRQKC